jgi:UDP-N-acetylbacillosamine N-acetyltransferase
VSERPGLVLMGFGGHARSVADVALAAGYTELVFVDPNARDNERFLDFPVQRNAPSGEWLYMPSAGDNSLRLAQLIQIQNAGLPVATILSPLASIARGAIVAPGCFIGHHSHLGPQATLGEGCILNTGAIVEHDCRIGRGSHVSIRSCVAGYGALGDRVFLGAGAVVVDRVTIASDVLIGAGGVVVESIKSAGVYAGVPARCISKQ